MRWLRISKHVKLTHVALVAVIVFVAIVTNKGKLKEDPPDTFSIQRRSSLPEVDNLNQIRSSAKSNVLSPLKTPRSEALSQTGRYHDTGSHRDTYKPSRTGSIFPPRRDTHVELNHVVPGNVANGTGNLSATKKQTVKHDLNYQAGSSKLKFANGELNACTDEFKARHLMRTYVDGRIGNKLFKLLTLLVAANDSCYTAVIAPWTLDLDTIFVIRNIVRITNYNELNFRTVIETNWGVYNGPIHRQISTKRNWTIQGFHQSFKYFQHKKELVKSSFVFKNAIKTDVLSYFKTVSLDSKIKVGIHVRRRDFMDEVKLKFGYRPSSLQYINRAMRYYNTTMNSKQLAFVFVSDNIAWCKQNFKLENVYFSPFKDPGQDLFILTQCEHTIITTGTFGWMGAWLNETGSVIYDKSYPVPYSILWLGHHKEDYYPDWWIGL